MVRIIARKCSRRKGAYGRDDTSARENTPFHRRKKRAYTERDNIIVATNIILNISLEVHLQTVGLQARHHQHPYYQLHHYQLCFFR